MSAFLVHPQRARRAFLAFVAVLALLLQPWVGAGRAAAMAMGTEICTTTGVQLLDAQGKAVDASTHASHDCCCTGTLWLPAGLAFEGAGSFAQESPAEVLTTSRLDAEWLAPLSRGPPTALHS